MKIKMKYWNKCNFGFNFDFLFLNIIKLFNNINSIIVK